MNTETLFKLSGAAAVLGGLARIFSAFPLVQNDMTREALYAAIDILLVFGLIGIYLARASRLGIVGFTAFVLAMAGFSFIGGPDADVFGFSTYQEGAAVIAIAMVGISLAWLRAREKPLAAPLCWIGSVIAVGVFNLLPAPLPSYGFAAAGALFGAGFIVAGLPLVRPSAT